MCTASQSTWPQAERVLLQELAPGNTATEVARQLGRSRQDVQVMAAQLGVPFRAAAVPRTVAWQQGRYPQPGRLPRLDNWPSRLSSPAEVVAWLNRQSTLDPTSQRCLITLRWLLYEVMPDALPLASLEPASEETQKLPPLTSKRLFQ